MATITGKRFQMTDGAASPINLFPYTVSEAVYGLNNSISNAISSALSTISLSTYAGTSAIGSSVQPVYYNGSALVACNLSQTYAPYNAAGYLPLTGGTLRNSRRDMLYISSSDTDGPYISFGVGDNAVGFIGSRASFTWLGCSANRLFLDSTNASLRVGTDSTNYTVWHAGNDGSGSGLDADLLDGRHESQFLKYDWAGTQDCTSIMSSGFTAAHGWTNSPRGFGYGGVLTLRYDEYRAFQMFVASQDNSTSFSNLDLYVRWSYYNGGQEYSAWKTLYHSGNSNLSTVTWTCSNLYMNGEIANVTTITTANGSDYGLRYRTDPTWSTWARSVLQIYTDNTIMHVGAYGDAGTQINYAFFGGGYDSGYAIRVYPGSYPTVGSNIIWHAGNSNLSTIPWSCSGLTIGAPGSHGLIGCPYHTTDTNKYNYIDFYGASNDGDIRYVAGTWAGGDHISHRFLVGLGGSVDALTIENNGNVGIGTTTPSQALHVVGNILSTGDQIINSDLTLKTNLKDVTYSVSDIAKCRAVTFDWKDGHGHSAGSIAQDWKPLIPELVHGDEGNMTLAYGQIALVNTIIEAREIERLKERVAELEQQLKMRS